MPSGGDLDDMPIQQALTLLHVGLQPGITHAELVKAIGMEQSSVSRNTAALSKWHRLGKPGLDLIEQFEDPRERRRKIVYLTPKGRARISKALVALTGGPVDFDPVMSKEGMDRL